MLCRSLALHVVFLLAACSPESGDAPAVSVQDSAGVRMVDNVVPGGDVPVYGSLAEADLEIGVVQGDPVYAFSFVEDVRTLPNGDIVVVDGGAQGGAQELRIFDSRGRHVRTIGRQGDGPGEFGRLAPVAGVSADTIWTWDPRLSRLTWFRTDGEVLGNLIVSVGSRITELTRLSDGTYLAHFMSIPVGLGQGLVQASDHLWKLNAEGVLLDSLRNVGGTDVYVRGDLVLFPGFGRFPAYAVGADRIYTGWNGTYRLVARSLAGDPMTVASAPDLERPVDPTQVDAVRVRSQETCSSPLACEPLTRMWDAFQAPARQPAFSALEVDDRGYLWVAEYNPYGDLWEGWQGSGWHVFSPEGELLGRVAVPPGLVVHEIGSDYVLGVQKNELGVPFVRRFPLTRSN